MSEEIQRHKALLPRSHRVCECELCVRGRKFYAITEALSPEDKVWMRDFLDSVIETESTLEMLEASRKQKGKT